MSDTRFLANYFAQYRKVLSNTDVSKELVELKEMMSTCQAKGKKVIIVGNGGSAAIASHCAVDFNKVAGIRCVTFNESSLITCLANDYGYEAWVAKALEFHAEIGDLVVLISSSGKSPNMIRGAEYARSHGLTVVTFTGFSQRNPLKALGHLNFWMNSKTYNLIECFHQLWILSVCDLIAGSRHLSATDTSKKISQIQAVSPSVPSAA